MSDPMELRVLLAKARRQAIEECAEVAMKMATDAADDATGFYRDGEDAVAKRCDYAGETLDELATRIRLLAAHPKDSLGQQMGEGDGP